MNKETKAMYYYKQNGDSLEKYLISFNEYELKRLRDEMREKCCRIIPNQSGQYSKNPQAMEFDDRSFSKVLNLGVSKVVSKGTAPDVTYYNYSYTLHLYPEEVILIDKLLNRDNRVLGAIKFNEKPNYEKLINDANMEIDKIDNMNTKEKIKALEDFQTLIEEAKASENQLGTIAFQERFEKIVNLKLIEKIRFSDFKDCISFCNLDIKDLGFDYEGKTLVYKPKQNF